MEWMNVNIFISSTFNDMHAERDYLVKNVFPELSEWCERRKLRLVDIDLRWGVTSADSEAKNTVMACLKNIDDSRPFFLCLLGQRRGWVPKPDDISSSTLEFYPGVNPYVGANSVTEIEIEHALLAPMERLVNNKRTTPNPVSHALFFFRDGAYTSNLNEVQKRIYTNAAETDAAFTDKELESFKAKIRADWNDVFDYRCTFHKDMVTPELLTEGKDAAQGRLADFMVDSKPLNEFIIETLKAEIEKEFPGRTVADKQTALETDMEQQERFVVQNCEGFIPRSGDFDALDGYVNSDGNGIFALTAPAGVGKTMLLANFTQRLKRGGKKVYARFCGASDMTAEQYGLWQGIFDEAGIEIPATLDELYREMEKLLQKLSEKGAAVILLDAVNQLPDGNAVIDRIPHTLPRGIKLIVSTKEDDESARLITTLNDDVNVTVESVRPFSKDEDKKALINIYLEKYLKSLDDNYISMICSVSGSGNPLYLKILLSELRVFGAFKQLEDEIKKHGDTPKSAFTQVLMRLENDAAYANISPGVVVPLLFGLLASARKGLSEDELVFCFKKELPEATEKDIRDTMRYYTRQIRKFLARRDGRTDYLYESLMLAAKERYTDNMLHYHALLTDCFMSSADVNGDFSFAGKNSRAFEELPYHLYHSGNTETLGKMLCEYRFIFNKTKLCGIDSLLIDYGYFNIIKSNQSLLLLSKCLELSAHILRKDYMQMPSQLWGRLCDCDDNTVNAVLQSAVKDTSFSWLKPDSICMSIPFSALIKTYSGGARVNRAMLVLDDCVVIPEENNSISLINVETGKQVKSLTGHTHNVLSLCNTDDAIFSASADGSIKMWSRKNYKCIRTFEGHTDWIESITTDMNHLYSCSRDGSIRKWSIESGKSIWSYDIKEGMLIKMMIVNGKIICTSVHDQFHRDIIIISEADGKRLCKTTLFTTEANCMAVYDNKLFLGGSQGISIYSVDNLECLTKHNMHSVYSMLFYRKRLITASTDKTIKIWNAETLECMNTLSGHSETVNAIAFYNETLVSCSFDQTIKFWNISIQGQSGVLQHSKKVSVLLKHDKNVFSGSYDGTVKEWNFNILAFEKEYPKFDAMISTIASNESSIYVGYFGDRSRYSTLHCFESENPTETKEFPLCTYDVKKIIFHDDKVITAHNFNGINSLIAWSIKSGEQLFTFEKSDSAVLDAVTYNGDLFAAMQNQTIGIWDLDNGKLKQLFPVNSIISSILIVKDKLITAFRYSANYIGIFSLDTMEWEYSLAAIDEVNKIAAFEERIIGYNTENSWFTVWSKDLHNVECSYNADNNIQSCVASDNRILYGISTGQIFSLSFESGLAVDRDERFKDNNARDLSKSKIEKKQGLFSKFFGKK